MQLHLHLQSPDSVDEYNHAKRVLQAFYDLPAGVLTLSSPKLSAEQLQGLRGDWNATKAAGTTILPGYDVLRGQEAEGEAEDDVAETPVPAPVATTTAPAEMDPQSPLILYAQPRAQITPADAARAAEALLLQEAASGVVPPRKRRTKAEMAAAKAAEAAIPPGPKASAEALSAALSGNFETAAPVVAETEPQPQSQSTPLVHTSVLDSLMAAPITPITPTPAALTTTTATATATEDSGDFTTWDITRLHGHIKALVSSPSHGPSWLKSKVLVPYGVSRISALSEDQARAVAEADFLETACA